MGSAAAPAPAPGYDAAYGLVVDALGDERARAHVVVEDRHKQPMGLVHGGLLASVAESLAVRATAAAVAADGASARGLSSQTSFLRPLFGGTLRAEARRRHRGRTTWLWEVDLTDDPGRLCALVRITVAVAPAPAA
jgi:uncharacterized protein (TIGR00369 family)